MFSVFRTLAVFACAAVAAAAPAAFENGLRVCADPNNLPFSNSQGEGFENRLAQMLAADMGVELNYFWWPQRRGFLRYGLQSGQCDVIMGIPSRMDSVSVTEPYYRSSYVLVSRETSSYKLQGLDDPKLRTLRIGVPVVGDDYSNTPPAQALADRGLTKNLVGYSVFGDYSVASPPAALVHAVETGEVDAAIAWGPLAGYFAKRSATPLVVSPIAGTNAGVPMAFDISMAVRPGDDNLRDKLNDFIARRRTDIRRLLDEFGVPLTREKSR